MPVQEDAITSNAATETRNLAQIQPPVTPAAEEKTLPEPSKDLAGMESPHDTAVLAPENEGEDSAKPQTSATPEALASRESLTVPTVFSPSLEHEQVAEDPTSPSEELKEEPAPSTLEAEADATIPERQLLPASETFSAPEDEENLTVPDLSTPKAVHAAETEAEPLARATSPVSTDYEALPQLPSLTKAPAPLEKTLPAQETAAKTE
ncbi:hypothetical protein CDD82_3703 [Ophiocordyceps australis]|uniref:Uncharacterized protein n=1 Tax=Ophiocordyceps australis TaxID=1399860 RepID=A0A2C5Z7L0_9HYPO|nr:hypothetical protein CDD82_3703 [Ophiocordyceps australis]